MGAIFSADYAETIDVYVDLRHNGKSNRINRGKKIIWH